MKEYYNRVIHLYHKFHDRFFALAGDFYRKWKHYSFEYAIYDMLYWVGFYSRKQNLAARYTHKKQVWLDKYFEEKYSDIVDRYRDAEESSVLASKYNIWVFWGQGEEAMPTLVKACYNQLLLNNPQTDLGGVFLIDLQNITQYINLPDTVLEKLSKGQLSYAHFSDILRNSLLAKYGGIWIDATCWTAHPVPEIANECIFFSPHNISDGTLWCTYTLGSNRLNSITFSFVRDMLTAVCIKEKVWPDYLLQDRLLDFAYRKLSASRIAIESAPTNSTRRFMLYQMMNKPFDSDYYKDLISTDWLFKLSYKSFYQKYCDGKETFYMKIVNSSINP